MRREEFAVPQQEHLVTIRDGIAFLPPPLPHDLPIPPAIWRRSEAARGAVGALEVRAEGFSTAQATWPLRLREARLSNEIEGTHTQVDEVLFAAALPGVRRSEAIEEVLATDAALAAGEEHLANGGRLDGWLLRSLHRLIMREREGSGELRRRQVVIGKHGDTPATARFVPPPPEQVEPALEGLFAFLAKERYAPVLDAALMHYQFEAIHPFEDGNGRLGRALIPLLWVQRGFLTRPILYLGGYLARRRSEYMDRLLRVSTEGDWFGWLEFFATGVEHEARATERRLRATASLLDGYRESVRTVSRAPTTRDAVGVLLKQPVVTAPSLAKELAVSQPAARAAIEDLVQIGALRPAGRLGGAAAYQAVELIAVLFGDDPA